MQRTIQILLKPTKQQFYILKETTEQFTEAFNHVCKVGWQQNEKNGVRLHHLTYYPLRTQLPDLCADHIIQARVRATEVLKSAFSKKKKGQKVSLPKSKSCPPRLPPEICKVDWNSSTVRISTTFGRQQIKISVPKYFQKYSAGEIKSSQLIYNASKWWLYIAISLPSPQIPAIEDSIGVDLGVIRPATTSNCEFLGERHWREVGNKLFRQKRSCQKKGTKSAKRRLKRLSGKQTRFRQNCDHVLSKQIISSINPGGTIVLENLKYILNRVKSQKRQRRHLHSWSFAQFQKFLTYKAEEKGIAVVLVDPRHTSQRCSKCSYRHRSNRVSQSNFCCRSCGFKLNADLNAARNIRAKYLVSFGISSTSRPLSTGPTDAQSNVSTSNSQVQTTANSCS